jgi:dUTP pyrophosphatase
MRIQVQKNENYNDTNTLPKAATERSTGYDIIATSDPEIVGEKNENGYNRIDYIQYKTNLKVAVQKDKVWTGGTSSPLDIDYDVLAMPRSSVSKYNLVLANSIGLIDADYRGEILVRFKYIWQPEDYLINTKLANDGAPLYQYLVGKPNIEKIYKKGDKICQLKITRVEHAEFYLVDELDQTVRGEGGFGSTDAKLNITTNNIQDFKEQMKQFASSTMMQAYEASKKSFTAPEKKYSDLMKEKQI